MIGLPWLILVAAIAATILVMLLSREFPSLPAAEEWVIRQRGSTVQRVRGLKPVGIDSAIFPVEVTVSMAYDGEMPSKNDAARLDRLEDRIEPLDNGAHGYLMCVTTGSGHRKWTWFVKDGEAFITETRKRVATADLDSLTFAQKSDAGWESYARMRRALM